MSGVDLRYVASSGNTYNLRSSRFRTKASAKFHKWKWDVNAIAQRFGERVTAFKRSATSYEATFTLLGPPDENQDMLNRLHEDFELDLWTMKPGRLIWGSYYIECFIIASDTSPDNNVAVNNPVTIYCPYPFWIRERTQSFHKQSSAQGGAYLDYPYDYDYDYYIGDGGYAIWQTGIPFGCDLEMIIYGPADDPCIFANGYPYQINVTLGAGEYLILNSRKSTITHHKANGQNVNAFDLRDKEHSVFEPMPSGDITFSWSGTFGFDLTIYEKRSEPRWT